MIRMSPSEPMPQLGSLAYRARRARTLWSAEEEEADDGHKGSGNASMRRSRRSSGVLQWTKTYELPSPSIFVKGMRRVERADRAHWAKGIAITADGYGS